MKNKSYYLALSILLASIGFNSCTIKKRLYQPGYHVQWNKTVKETNSTEVENVEKCQKVVGFVRTVRVQKEGGCSVCGRLSVIDFSIQRNFCSHKCNERS